jgi:hypothetical protein
MKTQFYLVVNKKGTTRTCKQKPGLDWDEISVKIDLVLPDTLFTKPQLSAKIDVPESDIKQHDISIDVIDNIKESIQQHTGLPIKISFVNNGDSSLTEQ